MAMKKTWIDVSRALVAVVMLGLLTGGCRVVSQNCNRSIVRLESPLAGLAELSEKVQLEVARSMSMQPLVSITNENVISDSELPIQMTKEVPIDLASGANIAAGTGITNRATTSAQESTTDTDTTQDVSD